MGRRWAARADRNQPEIVKALEAVGVQVEYLFRVGQGMPDLLCGYQGETYLLEVKMPGERLTPDELDFHRRWQGRPIFIVENVEQALKIFGFDVLTGDG